MTANDLPSGYTCSENYYKHPSGLVYIDGIKAFCETFECYWLLDIVCSYKHKLRDEEFQSWKLKRPAGTLALLTCDDGNGKILKQQLIPFTDFKPSGATVWIENNVVLLPSEH